MAVIDGENPGYGSGNPDWERDWERDRGFPERPRIPWLEDMLFPRCPTCDRVMVDAETQALAAKNS